MRRILGILLLGVAIAQLGFRGMQRVRSEIPLWDFASVYAAARTWTRGGDPYDRSAVLKTWQEAGAFANRDASYFATVYPPSSLLIVAPLGLLSAPAAMCVWLVVTSALLVLQLSVLAELAGLSWKDSRSLIFLGASLLSAPLQFGILSGQLSMPAISLCAIALYYVNQNREVTAGVLLGVACALKPQIGAPFFVYYFACRQWKVAIPLLLFGGGIGLTSIIAMHASNIHWLGGWTQSVAATQQRGAVNDYGWTNDFRDEIVDLRILLVSFIHNLRVLQITIGFVTLMLIGWYCWIVAQARSLINHRTKHQLLLVAAVCAISLLPIYHRVYDVTLLTLAFAWAMAELDGVRQKMARSLMIPMALFLIPFDIVEAVGRRIHKLGMLTHSAGWQTFIAPHYAWGLAAVTIMLLWILTRLAKDDFELARRSAD